MTKNNNLRVFDLKINNINGGSIQYLICKKNSKYKTNYKIIKKILNEERKLKLDKKKTYFDFFKEINNIRLKLRKLLNSLLHYQYFMTQKIQTNF